MHGYAFWVLSQLAYGATLLGEGSSKIKTKKTVQPRLANRLKDLGFVVSPDKNSSCIELMYNKPGGGYGRKLTGFTERLLVRAIPRAAPHLEPLC